MYIFYHYTFEGIKRIENEYLPICRVGSVAYTWPLKPVSSVIKGRASMQV